jgi:hypothetical protein
VHPGSSPLATVQCPCRREVRRRALSTLQGPCL